MPVLVDSSLWVRQLRESGDAAKRDRVNALLENGEAAWCPVVRLELWRGVTNDAERKTLRRYAALLPITTFLPRSGRGRFNSRSRPGIRRDDAAGRSPHLRVREHPRS